MSRLSARHSANPSTCVRSTSEITRSGARAKACWSARRPSPTTSTNTPARSSWFWTGSMTLGSSSAKITLRPLRSTFCRGVDPPALRRSGTQPSGTPPSGAGPNSIRPPERSTTVCRIRAKAASKAARTSVPSSKSMTRRCASSEVASSRPRRSSSLMRPRSPARFCEP